MLNFFNFSFEDGSIFCSSALGVFYSSLKFFCWSEVSLKPFRSKHWKDILFLGIILGWFFCKICLLFLFFLSSSCSSRCRSCSNWCLSCCEVSISSIKRLNLSSLKQHFYGKTFTGRFWITPLDVTCVCFVVSMLETSKNFSFRKEVFFYL